MFIVPCDAAPTRSGTAAASARRHTSAIRWLTSTLPAPTAAGKRAATSVPTGAITSTGRIAPALAGSPGSSALRNANSTHDTVTASTAFTFPDDCGSVPVKSNTSRPPAAATRQRIVAGMLLVGARPGGVEDVGRLPRAVAQRVERGAAPTLAVVEHLAERLAGERGQALHADDVRAELRVQVAGPLPRRARRRRRSARGPRR